MPIEIDYPTSATGEAGRMSGETLARYAGELRRQLFGMRTRPVEVDELARKTKRLAVNGRRICLAWDIEHEVEDHQGKPVLGICDVDPDAPDTVMISINGPRLVDRPGVFRSTAVHELAHAIFDMPAVLGKTRKAFQTSAETAAIAGGPIDWTEWRADAFMGAFLVPLSRLAHAVAKEAGALEIPFRWRSAAPNGMPIPFLDIDPNAEAVGWLMDSLTEAFGVTPAFIAVRLKKGGLIGRPRANDGRR